MDASLVKQMFIVIAGLLAAATMGSVYALRLQKQSQRLTNRVRLVTGAYARVAAPTEARQSARITAEQQPFLHQVFRIIGYDARYASHYSMKWYVVLLISFLAARAFAQLLMGLLGWIALAAVPVATVLIARYIHSWLIKRRRTKLYVQFPDALAMIVRGVRVGIPVAESMRVISREAEQPTASEFKQVADRVSLGAPLDQALYDLAERNDMAEYRFFATSIGLQAQTGGALSETLDNLADVIRKRVALRARGVALASEARTSIVILCSLPVVTGTVIYFLNPVYMMFLFNTALGKQILGAAVIMFSAGLGVMQWIMKKSLS